MNEDLIKDIVESNMSSDTKVELIKRLFKDKEKTKQPDWTIYNPCFVERTPLQDPYTVPNTITYSY